MEISQYFQGFRRAFRTMLLGRLLGPRLRGDDGLNGGDSAGTAHGRSTVRFYWLIILAFLGFQMAFSISVRPLRAGIEEMPFPLSKGTMKLLAAGDDQFLFRAAAWWLQGVGDGGGRVRPLVEYDYDRVVAWLTTLDRLDDRSDVTYMLASQYFGAVMMPAKRGPLVRKIVDYFIEQSRADPARHWPSMVWAAGRTLHILKDKALANRIAGELIGWQDNPSVPFWLPVLALPLYRFAGNSVAVAALQSDPQWLALRQRDLEKFSKAMEKYDLP